MRQFSTSFVYPALMLSALLVGCGGTSNQATVEGIVTLEGAPVPSGSISFVPTSGGTQSYAMSDAAGNYEVYTGREAGLKPGEYSVTIVARERPAVNQTELGGPAPAGAAITPAWYASPETSGLKFTVAPGANEINLELSKQAPAGWREPAKRR
ncbi:carboxypeptidase-like regulatory domain-containing protein [Lacipirellula parvula]|uniref:Carboxypeptidase regulatory-like domain-containing protein n=1 Tax=Lacipirellula parvula TaxID=2650471 RepID=A0A5K7XM57_9BACT|nr:carboxypeptidase-like regulatory domain-containing protein [Lacipirellula parvula]BBO35826.1 hypothetical protein PLANPX_5438 [Lacipirellula parvula]